MDKKKDFFKYICKLFMIIIFISFLTVIGYNNYNYDYDWEVFSGRADFTSFFGGFGKKKPRGVNGKLETKKKILKNRCRNGGFKHVKVD